MGEGSIDVTQSSKIDVSTVSVLDRSYNRRLIGSFFQLRRDVFINEMSWDLFQHQAQEFEQYDDPSTVYILVHEGEEVLGGARLIRTDRIVGTGRVRYTYMILDAYDGSITTIPAEICSERPPQDPMVWELTRFAVRRSHAGLGQVILGACNAYLASVNAHTCLMLGPPAFMRMAKSMGYRSSPLGPICGNKDGRFLAFSVNVVPTDQPFFAVTSVAQQGA